MLEIETIVVGALQCNCRIVHDSQTGDALIIDPGDNPADILDYVQSKGLKVQGLIHTHAHFDHVGATRAVRETIEAPIYLHRDDLPLYQNLQMQGNYFGIQLDEPLPVERFLEHEMELKTSGFEVKTLHTPGHTPGSCCFHLEVGDKSVVFTGDTLFQGSIGRTDLWGGDFSAIKKSIKDHLYRLDDDTLVLSGHGEPTTIGNEKRENPFVTG